MTRRRLFSVAAFASLLLCVATLVLCLVSVPFPLRWATTRDYYGFREGGPIFQRHRCVSISNAAVHVQAVDLGRLVSWDPVKTIIPGYPVAYVPKAPLGVGWVTQAAAGWSYREWSVPLWPLAALSAILPIRYHRRRRRSIVRGLCLNCRYDLRGNVSGVCPECGVAINHGII